MDSTAPRTFIRDKVKPQKMSPPEASDPLTLALRRLAAAEPDLGASRAENWHERVHALRLLRSAVTSYAIAERERGLPVERVIVDLKELVTGTLRAEHPAMEVAPIREKVVAWCAEAYFRAREQDGDDGATGTGGLTLIS